MRIAVLHASNQGFFPRFYAQERDAALSCGHDVRLFVPLTRRNLSNPLADQVTYGSRLNFPLHFLFYRLTGIQDVLSITATLQLCLQLWRWKPDVVHLNVIQECKVNFPMLAFVLNRLCCPVVWTFHDCRSFTGRCSYYSMSGCEKWMSGCGGCPADGLYSPSLVDASSFMWSLRSRVMRSIRRLHIVCPSEWMACQVRKSFLSHVPLRVIRNGVDLSAFRFGCDIRKERMILAVASSWSLRKGLDTVCWLAERMEPDVRIVVVGDIPVTLSERHPRIEYAGRIVETAELAGLFSRATVFVNPTLEDNFPTVNIEALASGTPVVTYSSGGSAECLSEDCGISVSSGNREAFLEAVNFVLAHPERFSPESCMRRAGDFSACQYGRYIEFFEDLQNGK